MPAGGNQKKDNAKEGCLSGDIETASDLQLCTFGLFTCCFHLLCLDLFLSSGRKAEVVATFIS